MEATGPGVLELMYGSAAITFIPLRALFGCRGIGSVHGAVRDGFPGITGPCKHAVKLYIPRAANICTFSLIMHVCEDDGIGH